MTITPKLSESLEIPFNALTIGKEIGRGGFGIVYEGSHRYSKVAIKKLLVGELSQEALKEFQNETKIMWNMRSPNIVQLYGSCSSAPPYCMVMELVEGGSLFGFLQKDKKQDIPWKLRLSIATDIARGVLTLHAHNILHRDLKSLNVLLDEHQTAKLTDFGLSKIKTQTPIAIKSELAGTPAWMAPELFQRKSVFTQKSDMYSYGMVVWEIASRDIPFKDAHGDQGLIIHWVSKGEREDIPQGTPQKISNLIEACWKENPEERPDAKTTVETLLKIDPPPSTNTSEPRYLDNLNSFTSSTPSYLGNLETQPSKMPNTPPAPLKLKSPAISPEGAKALALVLEKNSTFTSLSLSDNNIGPEGAKGKIMNNNIPALSWVSPYGNFTLTQAEGERFIKVKRSICDYLAKTGALAKGANVTGFSITSLSRVVTYIDPKTNNQQSLDLLNIQDPETNRAIEEYYSQSLTKEQVRATRVASNNKGNLNGPEALKRSTEYLKRLPKTFPENRDKAPQYVKDRFEFVKQFEQDFTKVVSGKMVEVESAIQKAPNDQEKEKLIQKKNQLIHIRNEVNQLDRYSLSKVLEKYPEKGLVDIKKVAQAIETEVQADIGTRKQSFIGLFIGRTPELDNKENEYCKDVAGLLYGINGGRQEYFAYCEDVNMSKKKEHINDVFIRAALEYMADKQNYQGNYVRASYLFDGLSPDLAKGISEGLKLKEVPTPAAPLIPVAPNVPFSGRSSNQSFEDEIEEKSGKIQPNSGKIKELERRSKNYTPKAPSPPLAPNVPVSGRSSNQSFEDEIDFLRN